MNPTRVWWVSWRVGEITVSSKTDDGRHDTRIAVDTPADWRYFLRIFTMSDGSVLLRGANADGTELHRITSPGVLVPVPDLPAQLAALPPYQVLPQADGTVLGLVDQGVVLWTSGGTLQTVSAPAGMVVRDATCDMVGACGSAGASQRLGEVTSRPEGRGQSPTMAARPGRCGPAWPAAYVMPGGRCCPAQRKSSAGFAYSMVTLC